MAMLNFKYGLHTNLVAKDTNGNLKVPVNNGTIYVTTDEHAMYVDLNDSRIRISQIVSLPTITEWQNLTPPYNTECFYYIIEANALLKCNGTNADGSGKWTQINSTAALESEISDIKTRLGTVETDLGTLTTNHNTLSSNFNDYKTATDKTLESYGKGIGDLGTGVSEIQADITELNTVLGYRGKVSATTEITNPASNDICAVGDVIYRYDGTKGEWVVYGDIVDVIEALRAQIVEANGGFVTTAQFENLTNTVNGKANKVANANAGNLAGLDTDGNLTDSGIAATDVATKDEVAAAKQAGDDAQDTADEALEKANTNAGLITNLQSGKVDKVTTATKDNIVIFGEGGAVADSGKKLSDLATAQAAQDAYNLADTANKEAGAVRVIAERADTQSGQNKTAIEGLQSSKINVVTGATAGNVTVMKADGSVADGGVLLSDLAKTADVEASLEAADTKAQGYASAVQGATTETVASAITKIGQTNAALGSLSGEVAENKTAAEKAIQELRETIVSDMQTADAMVFQGVLGSAADIRTAQSKPDMAKGWTYKANKEIVLGDSDTDINIEWADEEDKVIRIGDLLIADGNEDAEGVLTSVTWKHVPSGYTANYNPEMEVVSVAGSNMATINLTSGANKDSELSSDQGDLGAVSFSAAADSAMTVSVQGTNNVVIGMAWSSFDEEATA